MFKEGSFFHLDFERCAQDGKTQDELPFLNRKALTHTKFGFKSFIQSFDLLTDFSSVALNYHVNTMLDKFIADYIRLINIHCIVEQNKSVGIFVYMINKFLESFISFVILDHFNSNKRYKVRVWLEHH